MAWALMSICVLHHLWHLPQMLLQPAWLPILFQLALQLLLRGCGMLHPRSVWEGSACCRFFLCRRPRAARCMTMAQRRQATQHIT